MVYQKKNQLGWWFWHRNIIMKMMMVMMMVLMAMMMVMMMMMMAMIVTAPGSPALPPRQRDRRCWSAAGSPGGNDYPIKTIMMIFITKTKNDHESELNSTSSLLMALPPIPSLSCPLWLHCHLHSRHRHYFLHLDHQQSTPQIIWIRPVIIVDYSRYSIKVVSCKTLVRLG